MKPKVIKYYDHNELLYDRETFSLRELIKKYQSVLEDETADVFIEISPYTDHCYCWDTTNCCGGSTPYTNYGILVQREETEEEAAARIQKDAELKEKRKKKRELKKK